MHQAKLLDAFHGLPVPNFFNNDFEIIDWGCGQGCI
jgi:hypothetical protein